MMPGRYSRADDSENIRQLSAFRAFWSQSDEYPEENYGNDRVYMPAEITYHWAGGRSKMTFTSVFRAHVGSGPYDGVVDIDDTAKVKIEEFHLRFNPSFQIYLYDEDTKTLTISGSSDKMVGRYEVEISPAIAEP
jgi:hypothetical protein